MQLARFLNKFCKYDGFVLIDANTKKYIIGNPTKEKPIIIKILDKKLHYKLLLYPDLYLGEAYTDGTLIIENGSLTDFLDGYYHSPDEMHPHTPDFSDDDNVYFMYQMPNWNWNLTAI